MMTLSKYIYIYISHLSCLRQLIRLGLLGLVIVRGDPRRFMDLLWMFLMFRDFLWNWILSEFGSFDLRILALFLALLMGVKNNR